MNNVFMNEVKEYIKKMAGLLFIYLLAALFCIIVFNLISFQSEKIFISYVMSAQCFVMGLYVYICSKWVMYESA